MAGTPPAYVELHCHSAWSLREGASTTEELVLCARELGYTALALTDHDNLYSAMEFAKTATAWGVRPITGAEVTLADGHHLTLLAADRTGYGNLCRLLTAALHVDREHPRLEPALLPEHASGLIALSGCPKGEAASCLAAGDTNGAAAALGRLRQWFGPDNCYVELQNNLVYGDTRRNLALTRLARRIDLPVVATGNVHYHVRERHQLQDVLVAIRHRTTLDGSHHHRRPNSEFFLKSPSEMARLFQELPEALTNTVRIAERCTFDLSRDLDYQFPAYPTPAGQSPNAYLAEVCRAELARKYNPLASDLRRQAEERLTDELRLIARHGLAGFFLHHRDLVEMARQIAAELDGHPLHPALGRRPPGRGRGSSVGSIVCYLIGLSHIDPVSTNLFLGRFLNEELASVPDIDLDFPRDVRAEFLERIYATYGKEHVGMVCTFPTYQIKSAVREVGKALGLPEAELDKLAKASGWNSAKELAAEMARLPDFRDRVEAPLWRDLIARAAEIDGLPRHVSQHVGGVVISSQPLVELVPVEPAAMEGRFLMGWDKDSVDDARMLKIDFLALGMLSAVDECLDLIEDGRGQVVDLGRIPHDDPRVYDMICAGDTIGVFQIESRAQIQTLPRTRPRTIKDLTVEVAIIRPGPITGGAVNPYIARRQGREPVTYDHALLEPVLQETLGVVLYQEQVLQAAMAIAGFSAGQAESLRRAMSRKRSHEAMAALWEPFVAGARSKGVDEATARTLFDKLLGFATFGFPKAHSAAFALLAYESAWLKRYYPAEFYCALLNAQPMGFYSASTLQQDAARRGVQTLRPDINASRARATVAYPVPDSDADENAAAAVRLGLGFLEGLSMTTALAVEAERIRGGPYRSLREVVLRSGLRQEQIGHLIAVGVNDHVILPGA